MKNNTKKLLLLQLICAMAMPVNEKEQTAVDAVLCKKCEQQVFKPGSSPERCDASDGSRTPSPRSLIGLAEGLFDKGFTVQNLDESGQATEEITSTNEAKIKINRDKVNIWAQIIEGKFITADLDFIRQTKNITHGARFFIDIDGTITHECKDWYSWNPAIMFYQALTGENLNKFIYDLLLTKLPELADTDPKLKELLEQVNDRVGNILDFRSGKLLKSFEVFLHSFLGLRNQFGLTEQGWVGLFKDLDKLPYYLSSAHEAHLSEREKILKEQKVLVDNALAGTYEHTQIKDAEGKIVGTRMQNFIHCNGEATMSTGSEGSKTALIRAMTGEHTVVFIDNEDRHLKDMIEILKNNTLIKNLIIIKYKAPERKETELEIKIGKLYAGFQLAQKNVKDATEDTKAGAQEALDKLLASEDTAWFKNSFEAYFTEQGLAAVSDFIKYLKLNPRSRSPSKEKGLSQQDLDAISAGVANGLFRLLAQQAHLQIEGTRISSQGSDESSRDSKKSKTAIEAIVEETTDKEPEQAKPRIEDVTDKEQAKPRVEEITDKEQEQKA